ncbi:MAG: helix-turn-helix transcriptional regulator [Microthrixaceae bacterium]
MRQKERSTGSRQPSDSPLGQFVNTRRSELGLSMQKVADIAKVDLTYISKLEAGLVHRPKPEILHGLAEALQTPPADIFALVGYQLPADLPSFAPYLRAKYGLGSQALDDMADYLQFIQSKYGLTDTGPDGGEDEEQPPM